MNCCNYMGCQWAREKSPKLGHYKFHIWLKWSRLCKKARTWLRSFSALDYSKIEDVEVDGIDTRDYPDFCDAYISSATYKGRDMTAKELERLNEDSDYVYQAVQDHLY